MRIFLFFIFFYLLSYNSYAINVATFQFSKILDNSIHYEKFRKELDIFKEKTFFDLKKEEENLFIKKNKIIDSKVILNEEEYKKKISEYEIETKNFEFKVNKYNNYIQSNIEFNENIILNKISTIVQNIVVENNIELVLNDNQYYLSSDNIDISNIIIEKLNKIELKLILKNYE